MSEKNDSIPISFSIRTKLLISVVLIFFVIILSLSISTAYILKDDKLAYVYRSQAIEASLEARGFVDQARTTIETLRILLGAKETNSRQAIISNQSIVLAAWLVDVNSADGSLDSSVPLLSIPNKKRLGEVSLSGQSLNFPESSIRNVLGELSKDSYAFVNATKADGLPLLAVLVVGARFDGKMRVACGLISLNDFGREATGQTLTIATKTGWVLFDKDRALNFSRKNIFEDPLFQFASSSRVHSGVREFRTPAEHYLGSFIQPGMNLIVVSRTDWEKAMVSTYALLEKYILLGSMAIGIAVIFSILFAKSLTAPLLALHDATKEVSRGNFKVVLADTSAHDEIGALTNSFGMMSRKIEVLIAESIEKVRLENEVNIAATVQETLLPEKSFRHERFEIHSHYQPATECGGDWWGFFEGGCEGDVKLYLMIGDATGHGLPSALMTASARSCFSTLRKFNEIDPMTAMSPSVMLSFANRAIYEAAHGKINMTFFAGVIDFKENKFTYSNAGHNLPWLYRLHEGAASVKALVGSGPRLGEAMELSPAILEEHVVDLQTNDTLLLYTDGLTEGTDVQGKMYGKKRAREIIAANVKDAPEKIVAALVNDFTEHNKGKALDDDFTLAAIRLL